MLEKFASKILGLGLMFYFFASFQTTGYFIQDSNLPASDTRKIIATTFGQPRVVSSNGRELFSLYHNDKFESLEDTESTPERFYTKTTILGAKRPFEIQIEVVWERYELETDAYVYSGVSEDLSFRRANALRKSLKEAVEAGIKLDGDVPF